MELTVYTDGGAIGNPGPAAFAYLIYKDSQLIASQSKYIGRATNNVAEYTGLIASLEKILNLKSQNELGDLSKIYINSDSSLLVNQLNGLFKIKNAVIREFVFKIRSLENQVGASIIYKHIPREQNLLADSLVKKTLKNSS